MKLSLILTLFFSLITLRADASDAANSSVISINCQTILSEITVTKPGIGFGFIRSKKIAHLNYAQKNRLMKMVNELREDKSEEAFLELFARDFALVDSLLPIQDADLILAIVYFSYSKAKPVETVVLELGKAKKSLERTFKKSTLNQTGNSFLLKSSSQNLEWSVAYNIFVLTLSNGLDLEKVSGKMFSLGASRFEDIESALLASELLKMQINDFLFKLEKIKNRISFNHSQIAGYATEEVLQRPEFFEAVKLLTLLKTSKELEDIEKLQHEVNIVVNDEPELNSFSDVHYFIAFNLATERNQALDNYQYQVPWIVPPKQN